jgi:tetratricopeptide (TPR) repeat protein
MNPRSLLLTTLSGLLTCGALSLIGMKPAAATPVLVSSQQQAETLYNQGILQHEKGNLEAAIALYTDSLELNPESVETYSARAGAWGNLEEYDAAIEDYSAAIELDDNFAPAYGGRGLALSLKGELNAGVEDLWTAAQLFREQNQVEQYFKTLAIIESLAP